MPGINVAPDSYRWLARHLVADGLCVATYAAIGPLGPAGTGITPGLDMAALAPETIGTRLCATALVPLLDELAELCVPGDRAGSAAAGGSGAVPLLDLDRVVVGGHSAGGTVALHSSNPEWVRGLRAVFTYGAHTMTATAVGHGAAAVAPVPALVPVMLLGGTDDGVISASRDRYSVADDADHDPVRRTFDEGIARDSGDSWLIELAGAGHFALCWPLDTTSGRAFLEPDRACDDPQVRELLGDLVAAFIADSLQRPVAGYASLERLVAHPRVHRWSRR